MKNPDGTPFVDPLTESDLKAIIAAFERTDRLMIRADWLEHYVSSQPRLNDPLNVAGIDVHKWAREVASFSLSFIRCKESTLDAMRFSTKWVTENHHDTEEPAEP